MESATTASRTCGRSCASGRRATERRTPGGSHRKRVARCDELPAQRALAVDSLAAECAARLALATNEDYSANPLNKYRLSRSCYYLKRALQDAAKAVEAEEAAIEGEARTLHEVEADMRACTRRLLAGDTTVAAKLSRSTWNWTPTRKTRSKRKERNELWDLQELANALCLAATRRLASAYVSTSSIKVLRRLYASALPDNVDASRKLARRVFHTPALWPGYATSQKELAPARGRPDAQVRPRTQLDVVELRAVYGAVKFGTDGATARGTRTGRAAWRKRRGIGWWRWWTGSGAGRCGPMKRGARSTRPSTRRASI